MLQGMLLFATVAVAGAPPRPNCSADTLSGAYGVQRNGRNNAGSYTSSVGLAVFDGRGNLTGYETVSSNGTFADRQLFQIYSVDSDCSGTITDADGAVTRIMISHGGDTAFGMSLGPGRNEAVHYARVAAAAGAESQCAQDSFVGTYVFQRNGRTSQGDLLAVGLFTSSADSKQEGSQTISRNGVVSNVTVSNTFSMNPDCTGILIDTNGKPFGAFVMIHGASEALGMSLSPGNNVVVHYERVVDPESTPGIDRCHDEVDRRN
jgi:hypothetical protein